MRFQFILLTILNIAYLPLISSSRSGSRPPTIRSRTHHFLPSERSSENIPCTSRTADIDCHNPLTRGYTHLAGMPDDLACGNRLSVECDEEIECKDDENGNNGRECRAVVRR
ncbi:hypothetical protein BKA65DRAFT_513888 [Rhexocercosporidium sp. MPI-PUGE-AT-0058]|nr:hypothetical protein BKA65DRAFT_513888 [Rhexocercosporidium sp. MPI-PUGE-AT-0058]